MSFGGEELAYADAHLTSADNAYFFVHFFTFFTLLL